MQPLRCLWCCGGHLYRECPEKTNTESTPSYCNWTLVGQKSHPASYRGCSHAKGEHSELPRDPQGGHSSLSSPHQEIPTQLHRVKTINTSNHRHRSQMENCLKPLQQHLLQQEFEKTGLSVQAPISSDSDTVATVVHQIMTAQWNCVRRSQNNGHYKMVLMLIKMAARVHRPLKVIAFNANGISWQLQDLHIKVAVLSGTQRKPHDKFFIPEYQFYRTDRFPWRKSGTAVAVRKGITHNRVDLFPPVWIEATGVCIPISNSEVLRARVVTGPRLE
jgi:hypothetical protein